MNSPVLTDGDDRFYKLVTRLRPSQLGTGEVALSENGRMDVDGVWKCREGYKNVSGVTLSTTIVPRLVGVNEPSALDLIGSVGSTCTATGTTTVTVDTSTVADWIGADPGHTILLNLSGFTGGTGTLNGNRVATWVSNTSFTVVVTGVSGSWTGGTVGSFKLSGDTVKILGSCLMSDPATTAGDYILIADNAQATAIKVSDLTQVNVDYPAGETLSQECDLNQEFNKVILRQDGKTSWEWDMDLTGSPAFTKLASGAKTQHSIFDTTGNTVFADGVATVTESGHGLTQDSAYDAKTDPPREMLIVSSTDYDFLEGTVATLATVADANTFTYYANVEDNASTDIVYSTKASLGGGYINAPGAPWGVTHQRRTWVPYNYTDAATPVARNISDEIIASDILDNSTYDPIGNQFRVSSGRADFVTAMQGFDDDRLLVFCRNSIHYVKGVSGSLDDTENIQLTDEIGCLARKSVVQYANQVFFLSDSGVYAISFVDEFNLRGTDLPLSEAVNSIIDRITPSAADKSVGIYHDNRLWWALPLDGNTGNSHILIYSLLNGGWESLDFTAVSGQSGWQVVDLIEARSGKVNELYAVNATGGVHKLDGTGTDSDSIVINTGVVSEEIPSTMITRQYTFGDLRRKKFNRLRVHLKSDDFYRSQGALSVIVEDPDATADMGGIRDEFPSGIPSSETGTFHKRIGNLRGFGAQFKFVKESGRPAVRSIQIDAVGTYESTTSVGASAGAAT